MWKIRWNSAFLFFLHDMFEGQAVLLQNNFLEDNVCAFPWVRNSILAEKYNMWKYAIRFLLHDTCGSRKDFISAKYCCLFGSDVSFTWIAYCTHATMTCFLEKSLFCFMVMLLYIACFSFKWVTAFVNETLPKLASSLSLRNRTSVLTPMNSCTAELDKCTAAQWVSYR